MLRTAHADRVLPAGTFEQLEDLGVPESRVGAQQLGPGRAGPLDAGDELLAEALDPLLRVRRPLPQPDVQRLARVGAGGKDRVVAEDLGVAVGRSLLLVAADLADEAVDVDDQPPGPGAGAGPPRALKRLAEQRVELAHMPEGERAQKRSQRRRRRDPAAEQPARAARAQNVAVVDAVSTEHHRKQQRHHLAPRVRGPGTITSQPHQPARERLDSEPPSDRRDQHHASVRDDPLIVELDLQAVQSDSRVIVHHEGDLLIAGPGCPIQPRNACSGGHSSFWPGRIRPTRSVDPG
jgi:hypothetical protein